jgi:hypothetical protein
MPQSGGSHRTMEIEWILFRGPISKLLILEMFLLSAALAWKKWVRFKAMIFSDCVNYRLYDFDPMQSSLL